MASVTKREWTYKGQKKSAWVVRYFDEDVHRSSQFATKKDAEAFKRKLERDTEDGVHVAKSMGRTVGDIVEDFLKEEEIRLMDGRLSKGSFMNVRKCVNSSILRFLSHKVAHEMTVKDVTDFYASMITTGGLAPITAKERVIVLGRVMEFAIVLGCAKVNPVIGARKHLRGVVQEPIRTLTVEELGAIIRAADMKLPNKHPRTQRVTKCFVHLSAFCGLRWGEIAALTLESIDFAAGLIKVRHNLASWDELKSPKTKSGIRDVPLPDHVALILSDWIRNDYFDNPRKLLFRAKVSRTGGGPGGMITNSGFHASYWRPLLVLAGIDNDDDRVHFHALRHFAASWLIANGMPITDTATMLGHKKFDMTLQVYAHGIIGSTGRAKIATGAASRFMDGMTIMDAVAQEISQGAPAN